MIYILLTFSLMGCVNPAEVRAKSWMRQHEPTAPIAYLHCEDSDWDGDLRVNCLVKIESVGRIFTYKLKCYNSNNTAPFLSECIEVLDG